MDITPLDVQYEDVQDEEMPPVGLAPELVVTESSPMTSDARGLGRDRDSPDGGTPVEQSTEPVQVFGYLQKKGRRLKGWHQRWFEIRGQHMYYYKSNAKKHCLGEVLLSNCTHVHPTNAATFGHPFELVTKERSHLFAARTIEDMDKWIDCVKRNMGPRGGPKPKKINKIKKWDSFKNAFAITRHRSSSPQPSDVQPTASLPVGVTRNVDVTRNKSFLDRFKIRKARSNSPSDVARGAPEEKTPRPLSLRAEDMHSQLQSVQVDPPMAVSVPNTPLAMKKQEKQESDTSRTPSTHSMLTPRSSLGPSPLSSPEHTITEDPVPNSAPQHTSTPLTAGTKRPPVENTPISATPNAANDASPSKPKPPARIKKSPMKKQKSSPPSIGLRSIPDEDALPAILIQRLAWDDVKEVIEALPEEEEEEERLFPDILPPEEEPWMEKDTPLEQLREFLAVCA